MPVPKCRWRVTEPDIPMNCPACASDHTQRFSAIFEAGTTTTESKSSGVGVALTGGGLAPILTGSSSTGTHQTRLAARATPPARQGVGGPIVGAIVASPILAAIVGFVTGFACTLADVSPGTASTVAEAAFWGTLAMASIGFIALAAAGHKFNQEQLPALAQEWTQKWFCHRCSADFMDSKRVPSTPIPKKATDGRSVPLAKTTMTNQSRTAPGDKPSKKKANIVAVSATLVIVSYAGYVAKIGPSDIMSSVSTALSSSSTGSNDSRRELPSDIGSHRPITLATGASPTASAPSQYPTPEKESVTATSPPDLLGEFIEDLGWVLNPALRDRADDDAMYRELFDLPHYEWLTDSVIATTFPVFDGETYAIAGNRLTELGKKLCQIPRAETAYLCVVIAGSGKRRGRIELPLKSFLDFHYGDPTDRMMAASIWKQRAPDWVRMALESQ